MMYSDKVWDHFTNPRNVGEIADADGIGEVGNATCGDIMKIYLKINGDISPMSVKPSLRRCYRYQLDGNRDDQGQTGSAKHFS